MLRKGFLSCPSHVNRPISEVEKGEAPSPKQGNPPLPEEENRNGSSPNPSSSPSQGNRPLSVEGKGKAPCTELGEKPLSNKGKGNASSSKQGNRPRSKKGKGKGKGKWKGNPASWFPWDELSRMDPFERAMILESLDDDSPFDDFTGMRAMMLESLGDDSSCYDFGPEHLMLEALGYDTPWDDFTSKRAMFLESLKDDGSRDDLCSLGFMERASLLGNQTVPKKKKGKKSAHTAGKQKLKGNPRSWSLRDLNAKMDPFERAKVLDLLDDFQYLDAGERALYLESLDKSEINDIYKALFLEQWDDESEFGSEGGELSPETKDRLGREFDRNFDRSIEKAIAEKDNNGFDLLDVEIFNSMLGKPNLIDTDDFKQRFADVVEGGNEDDGRRIDMLRYLQSKYDAKETKSIYEQSHSKVKLSGSSGKDSLPGELGVMGAGFIPVVDCDEGTVKDNSYGLKDIKSLQLHLNSDEGYSKAKAKTKTQWKVKEIAKMEVKDRAEYDAPLQD